jgi:hypothetical protein
MWPTLREEWRKSADLSWCHQRTARPLPVRSAWLESLSQIQFGLSFDLIEFLIVEIVIHRHGRHTRLVESRRPIGPTSAQTSAMKEEDDITLERRPPIMMPNRVKA